MELGAHYEHGARAGGQQGGQQTQQAQGGQQAQQAQGQYAQQAGGQQAQQAGQYAPGHLMGAALALTISLAWNDAIKHFFTKATPWLKRYGPFGYAILVTILGIFVISLLFKDEQTNNARQIT